MITMQLQVMPQEGVIEVYVMRNEDAIIEQVEDMGCNVLEFRRPIQHLVCDAGKRTDIAGYRHAGIYQRFVLSFNFLPVKKNDRNFYNAIALGKTPGCFYIYDRKRQVW
jgi:hypothetical protein